MCLGVERVFLEPVQTTLQILSGYIATNVSSITPSGHRSVPHSPDINSHSTIATSARGGTCHKTSLAARPMIAGSSGAATLRARPIA